MGKARILLADNNEASLADWSKLLRNAGYDVVASSSIPEVRRLAQEEILDLAVLDLHWDAEDNINELSGLDLAREISPSTPCIILTGGANEEIAVMTLRQERPHGAAAVNLVKKQQHPNVLLQAVKNAIIPRVFLIHGHDNEAALLVERFLSRIGTRPVILRDLPGIGKAIIEKLERYANVSFAVALLTPDDLGGKKGEPSDRRSRARQNVIFELGYFIGKLGRNRVAVLHKNGEDLELPSDYSGIQYVLLDGGKGWQVELFNEMKNAGMAVNFSGS